jgi:tRNA C32,U32 (ribose-2'-O)-methylase TrmJ
MSRTWRTVGIVAGIAVVAIGVLVLSRGWIAKRVYFSASRQLTERLTPELKQKYEEELTYTMNKFWSVYEKGMISQNDMTDVMDKMKRLIKKESIEDEDIFNFGGYVSRIYADALQKHHQEQSTQ